MELSGFVLLWTLITRGISTAFMIRLITATAFCPISKVQSLIKTINNCHIFRYIVITQNQRMLPITFLCYHQLVI